MATFTWNAEDGCLTIHDPLFNGDAIFAEYPPYRQPAANAATTLLPIPSFSIEGARGHSKLINGEYRQVDGEWPGRLVFVNSVDMYLWPFAGRWRIGRRKNVGTLTCRLYTQCSASGYPDDLPATRGEQGWMENDGGLDGGSFVQSSAVHLVLSSAGKTARRARRAAAAELEAPLGAACAAADSRLAATLAEAVAHVVRSEKSGDSGCSSSGGGATPTKLFFLGDSLTAGYDATVSDKSKWATHRYPAVVQQLLGLELGGVIGASGQTAAGLWDKRVEGGNDVNNVPYPGLEPEIATQMAGAHGGDVACFIQLGTNDIASIILYFDANMDETIASTVRAIRQLHELCHAAGAKTIAMPIPPNKSLLVSEEFACAAELAGSTSGPLFDQYVAQLREYREAHRQINAQLEEWAASQPSDRVLWLNVWSTARGQVLGDYVTASVREVPLWSDTLHFSAAGYKELGELVTAAAGLRDFLGLPPTIAAPPFLPRPSDGASASASAALPRASVIARLEVGVSADGEDMQAVWGSACNLTLRRILAETEGLQLGRVSVAGIISRPRDVAGLAASLTPTCGVTALDLHECRVGLFGLRALLAAAARCESLETVDLFHVGPSFDGMHSEGGSIGCGCTAEPASSSPDCVLLLELCEILVLRGGSGVSNEALLDDCSGGGALYRAKRELAARCGM